jgi:hypothetical protein
MQRSAATGSRRGEGCNTVALLHGVPALGGFLETAEPTHVTR